MEKLIEWNDRLSVGSQEIDKQHKRLVDMINKLYASFKDGNAKDILSQILDDLYDYTDYHFETEEKYFRAFDFYDTENHLRQHKGFLKKVLEFKRDYKAGKVTAPYEVMLFLKDWLIKHIMGSDKKYVELFKKHGVR